MIGNDNPIFGDHPTDYNDQSVATLSPTSSSFSLRACSGRTRGAKKSDREAHFDRRELPRAQVDSKSSNFFSRRSAGARRGKVSASST